MRFTRAALKLRLQKVRSTSHFKNIYTYFQARKAKVFAISSVCFFLYCINKLYLRKYKGLKKLHQRFSYKDSSDNLILKSDLNYLNIFVANNNIPWAILFPKTIEETQKIIKNAIKYGLSVACLNIEHLEDSHVQSLNPYIVINQKNMNSFEFNEEEQTATIGVGLTIKELNAKLIEKGFYLPVSGSQHHLRLFELINLDNAKLLHSSLTSLSQYINSMHVVLASGEALCTNVPISKSGPGNSLNELFIGSNSSIAIPIDATIKPVPIPKRLFHIRIKAPIEKISTRIFELINDMKKVENFNKTKLFQSEIRVSEDSIEFEMMSERKLEFDEFFFKYYQELEIHDEKFENEGEEQKKWAKKLMDIRKEKTEEIFRFKFEEKEFSNLFIISKETYLGEIKKLRPNNKFWFTFDTLTKNFSLQILPTNKNDEKGINNEKFEEVYQRIMNYVINRNGLLIDFFDRKKFVEFKSKTRLIEFGKNNLHLQAFLKKMLDPKSVLINSTFNHEIVEK